MICSDDERSHCRLRRSESIWSDATMTFQRSTLSGNGRRTLQPPADPPALGVTLRNVCKFLKI